MLYKLQLFKKKAAVIPEQNIIQTGVIPDKPASYIVWWPEISSHNDQSSIAREMDRMVSFYHPEYIYLLMRWQDFEPKPNKYTFSTFDLIADEAVKRNIKFFIHISTDAYGGIGTAPFSYVYAGYSNNSWFWKHQRQKEDGTWETYGLYDPLKEAMRYPPTSGCNQNNKSYGKDFSILTGALSTNHIDNTCDGIEKVPVRSSWDMQTKIIKVREHPDLVYSAMDTSWPGNADGKDIVIHTPLPSFSSPGYRKEIGELWTKVVRHAKNKYKNFVAGYDVWHEPSYAHFKEYAYSVDYSQAELNMYNSALVSQGKPPVSSIPNPPDNTYIALKKNNLAGILSVAINAIKSVDPQAKVSFQLFMAGQNDPNAINNIFSVDPNILLNSLKPDWINEVTIGKEPGQNLDYQWYSGGLSIRQIYEVIKRLNQNNLPLMVGSVNLQEEVFRYNARYFVPIYTHFIDAGNVKNMPLIACWASQQSEEAWNNPNTLLPSKELSSAYSANYAHRITKGSLPSQMKVGKNYSRKFYTTNIGKNIWDWNDPAHPYGLGARWYNMNNKEIDRNGNEVSSNNYNPLNFRSYITQREIVYPGEQQKFIINIIPPSIPGEYNLEIDMVQEGVTWFSWQGSQTFSSTIRVVR